MKRNLKVVLAATAALTVVALAVLIAPARHALLTVPWGLLVLGCLTLGLAPFTPPHLIEKLQMLRAGTLERPLDWFDLALHAAPSLLLASKGLAVAVEPGLIRLSSPRSRRGQDQAQGQTCG